MFIIDHLSFFLSRYKPYPTTFWGLYLIHYLMYIPFWFYISLTLIKMFNSFRRIRAVHKTNIYLWYISDNKKDKISLFLILSPSFFYTTLSSLKILTFTLQSILTVIYLLICRCPNYICYLRYRRRISFWNIR